MQLPFTQTEFFDVFVRYNTTVWPLQLVFNGAAVLLLIGIAARWRGASRWTLAVLALLWAWIGIVYHAIFFRPINPAALVFAGLFMVEAVLLAWAARAPGVVAIRRDARSAAGTLLVFYGLLAYPLIGHFWTGHQYPAAPTFGLPCPTTLFTVGVLLWLQPLRPGLFVIPVLWSLIGLSAALRLGVVEDSGLGVAAAIGVIAVAAALRRRGRGAAGPPAAAA